MKAAFVKHFGALRPADEQAETILAKIAEGTTVMADVTRPRNVQHHRLLFALLKLTVDNTDRYPTVATLLSALKLATGHYDVVMVRRSWWARILAGLGLQETDDMPVLIPASISFTSMDQTAFDDFYSRCLDIIIRDILPGTDRDDLEREVYELIGEKGYGERVA